MYQGFLYLKKYPERNYYHDNIYPKLKAEEAEKEVVFLSMDDLLVLMDYNFDTIRLQKVRDLYCFASFTGLRYSDVVSLTHSTFLSKLIFLNGKSYQCQ